MSKCKVLFTSMAVVVFLSGVAQANLIDFFTTDAVSSWSPSGAVILQGISSPGPTGITMSAESNSTFTIIVTAVNNTSFDWTGYKLTLDPAGSATFVPGTGGSTVFKNAVLAGFYLLEFEEPDPVPIGSAVGLQFDLDIPGGGPHTFTLTQEPIPEPATVALLGLGTLVLLARRKN